ncbi:hypothetical protein SYNTR_1646 [Candidatus Syntrophocurvum alkaliphilum]|uniref:DUF3147 family protein n=1 Tax=Candidatus Syntrophocurvum alkaliphilum TaxID=2293317 RepID=A0A6I6DDN3_9FIRM|nr:GlpM family protein [Candidatus Syntrophocurvum alkaliphilum]QGU00240.1 hypothetical protein SYNTR_1646 [Candidatus Syntrophocurvum alkaliphilum]
MSLNELVFRFIAGGVVIVLISLLGKSKNEFLAGIAVLFPIVTVVGYYFLSFTSEPQILQKQVQFSLLALPAVLGFLLALYFTIHRLPIVYSLIAGILVWSAIAVPAALLGSRFLR